MYIQQIYTNCLAHAAYYIEAGHEAAVIDPLRDPEPYIKLAEERGAHIKYVMETHFHADFVSGHIDLANKTGAVIVFGPNATPGYKAYVAADGEHLPLGNLEIEVLHTPGHTIESTCYLLYDSFGKKHAVFTGDTLFVGDVGRPDLMSGNLSKEVLAGMLYDSLQNKIKTLPDDVIVYPGHGAGSACGKNIGISSFSTIGEQKHGNYALQAASKATFIAAVTNDLPFVPGYFFKDAALNKSGASPFDEVMEHSLKPLTADQFAAMQSAGALVLDTREPLTFAKGYVPDAINIGLTGDFAVWTGTLIAPDVPLILVCEPGKESEAIMRLSRIGYEHVKGYLDNGITAWKEDGRDLETIKTVNSADSMALVAEQDNYLLDVRNRREVAKHRMAGSIHIPLNELQQAYVTLDPHKRWLIYCAGGYRSMIAASFLKSKGYKHVASIEGGINEVAKVAPQMLELGLETE